MSMIGDILIAAIKGIDFKPEFSDNKKFKVWVSMLSPTTCKSCFDLHGKVYLPEEAPQRFPKLHYNCACIVEWLKSINMGTATFDADNGIDVSLSKGESLPTQYLTKKAAKKLGWKPFKLNLWLVTDFGVIGGDIYRNLDGKLPSADGRIWYEADINYTGGVRNSSRIIYSNDGLIFATYDHYFTFNLIQ